MKKIFSLLSIFTLAFLSYNCEEHDPAVSVDSFLSFGKGIQTINFVAESPEYPITVYASKVSNEDRVVNIVTLSGNDTNGNPFTTAVDSDFQLGSSSVIIPAGEMSVSTTISFDPDLSVIAERYVTFELQSSAEDFEFNKTSTRMKINYRRVCFSNTLVFNLDLDPWGSETSWDIKNAVGTIVRQGGPYQDYDVSGSLNFVVPTQTFDLPDGDYVFTIYDQYGDGMYYSSGGVNYVGHYDLSKDCGSILAKGQGQAGVTNVFEIKHEFSLP
jgi:hypothetical protein